jgi:hypothetical protein
MKDALALLNFMLLMRYSKATNIMCFILSPVASNNITFYLAGVDNWNNGGNHTRK